MSKQRSDSPTTRRIVRSFIDFLQTVESTSEDDVESLRVAKYCLRRAFGLNLPSADEEVPQGLLLDLFKSGSSSNPVDLDSPTSVEDSHVSEGKSEECLSSTDEEVPQGLLLDLFEPGSSSNPIDLDSPVSVKDSYFSGAKSKEELFERLYDAFHFKNSAREIPDQAAKAAQLFDKDCVDQKVSSDELGEFFKSKGNQSMQSNLYAQAVRLYTEAISLHKKNAVYYCNRAAAYIELNKNLEAIKDCLKAIEIDPKYTKAYFRLGSAYFALGNYHEALNKGYLRALKLDPNNQTIHEKIKVTKSKLNKEQMNVLYNSSEFRSFFNGSNTLNPDSGRP